MQEHLALSLATECLYIPQANYKFLQGNQSLYYPAKILTMKSGEEGEDGVGSNTGRIAIGDNVPLSLVSEDLAGGRI
jgi:hypothetical protein